MQSRNEGLILFASTQDEQPCNQGDTPLHLLIRNQQDANSLTRFIHETGEEKASIMAKTLNDNQLFPLDLIKGTKLTRKEKDELYAILIPLTEPKIKPLSEMLDIDTIQKEFCTQNNKRLLENLIWGVEAANYARSKIGLSDTHPQLNGSHPKFFSAARDKIDMLRQIISDDDDRILLVSTSDTYRFKTKNATGQIYIKIFFSEETKQKQLIKTADTIKRKGEGNCHELTILAQYYLLKRNYPAKKIEICSTEDHVFLVIDRGTTSFKFEDWSPAAVSCDPWTGEVYPASQILEKIGTFEQRRIKYGCNNVKLTINLIASLNLNYHSVSLNENINDRKCIIKYNHLTNLDAFIIKLHPLFSAREMMHFYAIIKPRIRQSLNTGLISQRELKLLQNPVPTLYTLFINDFGMMGLKARLFTLDEIDCLPNRMLQKLMTAEGIAFLSESKLYLQQVADMGEEQLDNRLIKFKKEAPVFREADCVSTLFKQYKKQVNETSIDESVNESIFLIPLS